MQSTSSTGLLRRRWLWLAIILIVLSTALFVTGIVIERTGAVRTLTSSHQDAQSSANTSQDPDGGRGEVPSIGSQKSAASPEQSSASAEAVFGLDLENPWVVSAFVLVWLVLVVALVWLGRIAWVALLLVTLVAVVLDVGEVGRQLAKANTTVATFAVLVALMHVALAVLALFITLASERRLSRFAFLAQR